MSPLLTDLIIQEKTDEKSFKVRIPPKKVQLDRKMVVNVPIFMIFTLFWSIDDDSGESTYMNIVYEFTLARKIIVQLERLDISKTELKKADVDNN